MLNQVLRFCLDRLEEGNIGRGPLVADPSQQVKHQQLSHADKKIIKLYCETLGVGALSCCGTRSGTSRQRARKLRRSKSRSCQPWPGAETQDENILNCSSPISVPKRKAY